MAVQGVDLCLDWRLPFSLLPRHPLDTYGRQTQKNRNLKTMYCIYRKAHIPTLYVYIINAWNIRPMYTWCSITFLFCAHAGFIIS